MTDGAYDQYIQLDKSCISTYNALSEVQNLETLFEKINYYLKYAANEDNAGVMWVNLEYKGKSNTSCL